MGIDRPDDADVPSDNPADRTPAAANDGQRSAASHVETRYREEYYSARTQVAQEERATTGAQQERQRRTPGPRPRTWPTGCGASTTGGGHRRAPTSRQIHRPTRLVAQRQQQLPNSSTNAQIEAECDRIVEREQEKITPAMRDIESQDPTRHLVGFEHRLKGRDRIKEKVHGTINDLTVLQSRLFR